MYWHACHEDKNEDNNLVDSTIHFIERNNAYVTCYNAG